VCLFVRVSQTKDDEVETEEADKGSKLTWWGGNISTWILAVFLQHLNSIQKYS
jgi:hypothetical protein